ncbi:MAG: hypothetical protein FWD13_08380 [Treponema sp.]|nr:hypothetical protein [Treponema sp.]
MKKISEKSRKFLRTIYRILGVTAISLVFQACYGMPMDWDWDNNYTGNPGTEEEAEGSSSLDDLNDSED